jgi:hypothetical protein
MFLSMAPGTECDQVSLRVVAGLTAETLVEIAELTLLAAIAVELADVQQFNTTSRISASA